MNAVTQPDARETVAKRATGLHGRELEVAEMWFAQRFAVALFAVGRTTREQRAGLVRARIESLGCADDEAWRGRGPNGTETGEKWRQVFERVYGEAL